MNYFNRTTSNYSGRTVDLLLLQLVSEPVSDKIVLPDVHDEPRIVSGIEKLVQRYAQLFLTQVGSIKNRPMEGADIMVQLGMGKIQDENSLKTYATGSNKAVMRQIRSEDASLETPDDEALEKSELIGVSIDRSSATATVSIMITSVAGDTFTYVTPLKTGI